MVADSSTVLHHEVQSARRKFESAKRAGVIAGEFDSETWKFRSKSLSFRALVLRHQAPPKLSNESISLGKAFIISEVSSRPGSSGDFIQGMLVAFRHLATLLELNGWTWASLGAVHLNSTLRYLGDRYSEATVYHRAGGLAAVVRFLNGIHVGRASSEQRFLRRRIGWKHKLTNPIRAALDPTSSDRTANRALKYMAELPDSVARARAKLVARPSLEPNPGYDFIRIEALAFMLALGVRVGEVTSLPIHALDEESVPGSLFLRVAVEKGSPATAMPVPSIWEGPVRGAYLYLLEACAEARAQARRIEESGFNFVDDLLQVQREATPLDKGSAAQLNVAGLDQSSHFFIFEISSCLNLTEKQFTAGGRYNDALINVPRPVASRIVEWLDERFADWDWLRFSRPKLRVEKPHTFVVHDLADAIGLRAGNISKQYSFISQLRELLSSMSEGGCFDPEVILDEARLESWRSNWSDLRAQIVCNVGGAHGAVVSLDLLKAALQRQFDNYLGRHFDELVEEEAGDGAEPTADVEPAYRGRKRVRPGMERRLSDHLFVVWDGQFASGRPRGLVPRPLFRSDMYRYLCASSGRRTVFDRLQIAGPDGDVVSFTPHMIRHWVTTAMLRSGPNELAVDMWMNRRPSQGRHYDHRTAKERAEMVRGLYMLPEPPPDFLGRRVKEWRRDRISEEEIEIMISEKLKVLHYSPWGTCSRDLYTAPCSKGLMCLRGFGSGTGCSSFQVDVSDLQAKEEIEKLLRENEKMLKSLYPHYDRISEALVAEMDTAMPLDQHLLYLLDVVRGCQSALECYSLASTEGVT